MDDQLSARQICEEKIDTSITDVLCRLSTKWQQEPTLVDCQSAITCELESDQKNHMVRRFAVTSILPNLQNEYTQEIETQRPFTFTSLKKMYPEIFPKIEEGVTKYFNQTTQERLPTENNNGSISAFNDSCQTMARALIDRTQQDRQLSTFKILLERQLNAEDNSAENISTAFLLGNNIYQKYNLPQDHRFWQIFISTFSPRLKLSETRNYTSILSDLFWAHHILKKMPETLQAISQKNKKGLIKEKKTVREQLKKFVKEEKLQAYVLCKFDQLAQNKNNTETERPQ